MRTPRGWCVVNPTWDQAVDAYVERLRGNNSSPATIETYRWLLIGSRAERFREARGIERPHDFTAALFEDLKREFLAAGLKPSTVHDYARVWRQFAKFCIEKGWGVQLSTLHVANPRLPKFQPASFTAKQEQELLAACRTPRDRMMVKLILETGLRRSEVSRLDLGDIEASSQGWVLRVRQGKGSKDRALPLSDAFAQELGIWLRTRPATRCPAMFLSLARIENGDYSRLDSQGIYQVWRRLGQATGIKAYPHKARHTAATRWAQDGVPPFAIQRALGHSTLAMTTRYVDASAIDLTEAFRHARQRIVETTGPSGGAHDLALSLLEGVSGKDLIGFLLQKQQSQRVGAS